MAPRTVDLVDGVPKTLHPLYPRWVGMRQRCTNERHHAFCWYGARGISVCAGWRASFALFVATMGPMPSRKHTVDRRNNEGGYWCGRCDECVALGRLFNCRWATQLQQQRNRRRRVYQPVDYTS